MVTTETTDRVSEAGVYSPGLSAPRAAAPEGVVGRRDFASRTWQRREVMHRYGWSLYLVQISSIVIIGSRPLGPAPEEGLCAMIAHRISKLARTVSVAVVLATAAVAVTPVAASAAPVAPVASVSAVHLGDLGPDYYSVAPHYGTRVEASVNITTPGAYRVRLTSSPSVQQPVTPSFVAVGVTFDGTNDGVGTYSLAGTTTVLTASHAFTRGTHRIVAGTPYALGANVSVDLVKA